MAEDKPSADYPDASPTPEEQGESGSGSEGFGGSENKNDNINQNASENSQENPGSEQDQGGGLGGYLDEVDVGEFGKPLGITEEPFGKNPPMGTIGGDENNVGEFGKPMGTVEEPFGKNRPMGTVGESESGGGGSEKGDSNGEEDRDDNGSVNENDNDNGNDNGGSFGGGGGNLGSREGLEDMPIKNPLGDWADKNPLGDWMDKDPLGDWFGKYADTEVVDETDLGGGGSGGSENKNEKTNENSNDRDDNDNTNSGSEQDQVEGNGEENENLSNDKSNNQNRSDTKESESNASEYKDANELDQDQVDQSDTDSKDIGEQSLDNSYQENHNIEGNSEGAQQTTILVENNSEPIQKTDGDKEQENDKAIDASQIEFIGLKPVEKIGDDKESKSETKTDKEGEQQEKATKMDASKLEFIPNPDYDESKYIKQLKGDYPGDYKESKSETKTDKKGEQKEDIAKIDASKMELIDYNPAENVGDDDESKSAIKNETDNEQQESVAKKEASKIERDTDTEERENREIKENFSSANKSAEEEEFNSKLTANNKYKQESREKNNQVEYSNMLKEQRFENLNAVNYSNEFDDYKNENGMSFNENSREFTQVSAQTTETIQETSEPQKKEPEKEEKSENTEEKSEIEEEKSQKEKEKSEKEEEKEGQEIDEEQVEKFRQETGRRPFYKGKPTVNFQEWLENENMIGKKEEINEIEEETSEKEEEKDEIIEKEEGTSKKEEKTEEWVLILTKLISNAKEEILSENEKALLLQLQYLYAALKNVFRLQVYLSKKTSISEEEEKELEAINELIDTIDPFTKEIFKTLAGFGRTFSKREVTRDEQQKFIRHLASKLKALQKSNNWKEVIKENVEILEKLNKNERDPVIQIIEKEKMSKENIEKIASILNTLHTDELISLFGYLYKIHSLNYVRWGYDFYKNQKKQIIIDFLQKIIYYNKKLSLNTHTRRAPRKLRRYKWTFLDRDEEDNILLYNERIEEAANYLLKNILTEEFRLKHKLKKVQAPTVNILKKHHSDFCFALEKRKLSYNDIFKELNLINNYDPRKWHFLDNDEKGKPLSYEDSVIKAANYLLKNILTEEFRIKYKIKKNQAPTRAMLEKENNDFVTAIIGRTRTIYYNDILRAADLKLNRTYNKWDFLNMKNEGEPLSYEESITMAADYLIENILTENLRKKYDLKKNQAPTREILMKQHSDFVNAYRNRRLSYNDILNEAVLKLNRDFEKWKFLDVDEYGDELNYEDRIKKAAEYFKNKILTDDFKKKHRLESGEAPVLTQIKLEKNDFVRAIGKRSILYNDILEESGYSRHEISTFKIVGKWIHIILEKLFLENAQERGCRSFHETFINILTEKGKNDKYRLNHIDNCIFISRSVKNLSINMSKLLEKYSNAKIILIDYYLGNSEKSAKYHSLRGYQNTERLLILVPINASKQGLIPKEIPFRENVIILDPKNFANLLGYHGRLLQEFNDAIKLAKDATWKEDGSKERLKELAKFNRKILKKSYRYDQKDLEEHLKIVKLSLDLLKYKSDNHNLDEWL